MSGRNYLDAPVYTALTSSTLQSNGEQARLYTDSGTAYSQYLSSILPQDDLSSVPSETYMATTQEPPSTNDVKSLVGPTTQGASIQPSMLQRQLVILDLNGSLLFRSKSSKTINGAKARTISRRPYLSCLAQYLAHERTRSAILIEKTNKKKKYRLLPPNLDVFAMPTQKRNGKKKSRQKAPQGALPVDGVMSQETIEHLRKKLKRHPERFALLAPLDAMVWSSVQPQNLLGMVDAAFGVQQEAMRACWTRGMLGLGREGYYAKVQTTKNLERIWWSSAGGYDAKTTVLVDDTAMKARLQPWNLLQVTEYTVAEARVGKANTNGGFLQADASPEEDSLSELPDDKEKEDGVDTTILAVIGILEELRAQRNIPAWIRSGGLWGNVPHSKGAELESSVTDVIPALLRKDEQSPDVGNAATTPLWCTNTAALSYWTNQGIKALKSRSISPLIGAINTHSEVLKPLRTLGIETSASVP